MHIEIQKENINNLLKYAFGVVKKKSSEEDDGFNIFLEVSADKLQVYATSKELQIQAHSKDLNIISTGQAIVDFRKLYDICKSVADKSNITIKNNNDNKLQIMVQKSNFNINQHADKAFPIINCNDVLFSVSLQKKSLLELLCKTMFAMAEQDVRYFLNGMLLEIKDSILTAVATDGHRLAKHCVALEEDPCFAATRIMLPKRAISEIFRILDESADMVSLVLTKKNIFLYTNNFVLISVLLEDKFPDYHNIIPKTAYKKIEFSRKNVKESFLRISAIFFEKNSSVKMQFSNNSVCLLACTDDFDEASEALDIDYSGESFEISFNAKYILDFLTISGSEKVFLTISSEKSCALLQDDSNWVYVLMPML